MPSISGAMCFDHAACEYLPSCCYTCTHSVVVGSFAVAIENASTLARRFTGPVSRSNQPGRAHYPPSCCIFARWASERSRCGRAALKTGLEIFRCQNMCFLTHSPVIALPEHIPGLCSVARQCSRLVLEQCRIGGTLTNYPDSAQFVICMRAYRMENRCMACNRTSGLQALGTSLLKC